MDAFRDAIEVFRRDRVGFYRNERQRQFDRDIGDVVETVKEHIGRWPLELVQNCDDAESREVLVKVTEDAVYVADKGKGLGPDAIESLTGTHWSNKSVGAIGRKGLGFKAVYEITSCPAVFTKDDAGVLFDPERARVELSGILGREFAGRVPHEWLPFWVSRRDAAMTDPVLAGLADWITVVRLPLDKPEALEKALRVLDGLPAHVLLTFRHVWSVHIESDGATRTIERQPMDANVWRVSDSKTGGPLDWVVQSRRIAVPPEKLNALEEKDRRLMGDVSLLVAAPVAQGGVVVPAEQYPKICVYYPIGKEANDGISPVRLLLHADFLVTSDRQEVLALESCPLNGWIADRLAKAVIEFVKASYVGDAPAAFLRLLAPYEKRGEHPLAEQLWTRILNAANEVLLLPDASGQCRLKGGEGCIVDVSVDQSTARRILTSGPWASGLLHESIEQNAEAGGVVRHLGCTAIGDERLLDAIAQLGPAQTRQEEWLWDCCAWLSEWLQAKPKWDPEHNERLKRIRGLPVLPTGGGNVTRDSLGDDAAVTWRDGPHVEALPEWMPLHFLDAWFRNRLKALGETDPLRQLMEELEVNPPTKELFLRAFGIAVRRHWRKPAEEPGRLLAWLSGCRWLSTTEATEPVTRCPVPVTVEGSNEPTWEEARKTYFGREWGEVLLADVYKGTPGVAWAVLPEKDSDQYRQVLKWLGVARWPRVIEGPRGACDMKAEAERIRPHIKGNSYLRRPSPPMVLDRVCVSELVGPQAGALVRLVSRYWMDYYSGKKEIQVACKGPQGGSRSDQSVIAKWWEDFQEVLVPPLKSAYAQAAPLKECWLPDPETEKAIGPFLAAIDLDSFGEDRNTVEQWFRRTLDLRTHLGQVTGPEWTTILGEFLPRLIEKSGTSNESLRVARACYEAALTSIEGEDLPDKLSIPLLCGRGDESRLVPPGEPRWIADDAECAEIFKDVVWVFSIPEQCYPGAKERLGVKSLKGSVQREQLYDPGEAKEDHKLSHIYQDAAPFVFAWRRHRPSGKIERLRELLAGLQVKTLPSMDVRLTLPEIGVTREHQERFKGGVGKVFLREDTAGVPMLAKAIAEALGLSRESANLLENLLRCGDDTARKDKLVSENIPGNELDRYVAEYRGSAGEQAGPSDEAPPGDRGRQVERRIVGPPVRPESPGETVQRGAPHQGDGLPPGPASPPEPIADLKDVDTDEYVCEGPPAPRELNKPPRQSDTPDTPDTPPSLSPADRKATEQAARRYVTRELEKQGYAVEPMPLDNEGFDLRATKGADVLEVEVKGHRGRAWVIEITDAQVREYQRCREGSSCATWQLWNVQNLARGSPDGVVLTPIDDIPRDALRAQSYRFDLRRSRTGHPTAG